MPAELLQEFIGKEVSINLFNESFASKGMIVEVVDNWIKVEEKNCTRLINGDMIRDLSLVKPKEKKQR